MKKHRFNIYPEMNSEDYNEVKNDIQENGYDEKQPIYIYQGDILDGWNRYNICKEIGVEPVKKEFIGTDSEAFRYVVRTNKRRNLNSSQRGALAAEAEDIEKIIQQEVEAERRRKQAETKTGMKYKENLCDKKLSHKNRDEHANAVHTKMAKAFGTNRTYVNDMKKIQHEDKEAFVKIKNGEQTISEYKKHKKIEQREKELEQIKSKIESDETKQPEGLFDVIVIDPPWAYGRKYDPNGSRIASPYPEMKQEELLQLTLPAKESCVLFLWTTHKFIWDAKDLLDKWGFNYKAQIVWDKEKLGMGNWLRMQCEFCLVGIKGKPIWNNTTHRDILREPRKEHSRKPGIFYDMVEDITFGRKLDYFSRENRDGWETWGAEIGKLGR